MLIITLKEKVGSGRKSEEFEANNNFKADIILIFPQNFAHEFGHLLGMYHDFERTRVYNQRLSHLQAGCDHKGIMSYTLNGKLAPAQWTHCSQQDFTHVYNWNVFKRKWCL